MPALTLASWFSYSLFDKDPDLSAASISSAKLKLRPCKTDRPKPASTGGPPNFLELATAASNLVGVNPSDLR